MVDDLPEIGNPHERSDGKNAKPSTFDPIPIGKIQTDIDQMPVFDAKPESLATRPSDSDSPALTGPSHVVSPIDPVAILITPAKP
jgi:hypothetical protein